MSTMCLPDPEYDKYFKMEKCGVPRAAVRPQAYSCSLLLAIHECDIQYLILQYQLGWYSNIPILKSICSGVHAIDNTNLEDLSPPLTSFLRCA